MRATVRWSIFGAAIGMACHLAAATSNPVASLDPSKMPRVAVIDTRSQRFVLTARELEDTRVRLKLLLGKDDAFPAMNGDAARAGVQTFPPSSITYLAIPRAGSSACR